MESNELNPVVSNPQQSRAEKKFKEALEQVEALKKELAITEELAENYLLLYYTKITPTQTRYGLKLIELAISLELRSHKWNLSKSNLVSLSEAIISILRYASFLVDLTDEAQVLWVQYSETSHYGQNIDLQETQEMHEEATPEKDDKQEETQNEEIDYQALKSVAKDKHDLKKLRAIYIRLAKLLHPDKHASSSEPSTSEAEMKAVTQAYESKDLLTLLNLEMKHIAKTGKHIDDQNLVKSYISTLRKQAKALRQELLQLKNNPRFGVIRSFLDHKNQINVETKINRDVSENKKSIKAIDYNLKYIRATQHKNDFLNLLHIIDTDFNNYSEN